MKKEANEDLRHMLEAPPEHELEHFNKFFNETHPFCLDNIVSIIDIKSFMEKLARVKVETYIKEIYEPHVAPKLETFGSFEAQTPPAPSQSCVF